MSTEDLMYSMITYESSDIMMSRSSVSSSGVGISFYINYLYMLSITSSRVFCFIPRYSSAMACLRFSRDLCIFLGSICAMSSLSLTLSFFFPNTWVLWWSRLLNGISTGSLRESHLPPPCSYFDSWYEIILDFYRISSSSVCISSPGYLSLMTSPVIWSSSTICCEAVFIPPSELMRLRILCWEGLPPVEVVETLCYW